MVDLEIMIALVFITYIVNFDAYELYLGDEKSSMTLLMNARILHYIYDRGLLLFKCIVVDLC